MNVEYEVNINKNVWLVKNFEYKVNWKCVIGSEHWIWIKNAWFHGL